MTEVVTKSKPATTKASKPKKPKKEAKPIREPVKVDLAALAGLQDCELWTKKGVKFDHPEVDVNAHVLVFSAGEASRKLCFNSYDGNLGKKSPPLPIDEFLADKEVSGAKRPKPWFQVKDLEKTKTKLGKDGYEQHK
jgi:hypothetical protein